MKKQIGLLLVVCLGFTPFSSFAQVSSAQYASMQAQINNQYLKALEEIKQQELENIQRLRREYQEQQRLLMMQLNQVSQDVSTQYAPELGVATAAGAVTLRKKMQDKKGAAHEQYRKSLAGLKETFKTQQKKISDIYQDARQNAKKQLNTFLSGAKTNGQAAVDAAVSSFARFGNAVGKQGSRLVDAERSAFNAVRNAFYDKLARKSRTAALATIEGVRSGVEYAGERARAFGTGIAERARAVGRGITATPGALSGVTTALSKAAQTRLSNVRQWFNDGKDRLVGQIKELQANAAALKEKLTAAGTRPFNNQEKAEVDAQLQAIGATIGTLATTGVVPVASAQAPRASWIQRMYEKSKRAVTAPIQKMANSWRQFNEKMKCFGNKACTIEQRKEAGKAFLKVYLTIYALFVLVVYGTVLTVAISEMMQEEQAREHRAVSTRDTLARPQRSAMRQRVPSVAPSGEALPPGVEPIELFEEGEEEVLYTPVRIDRGAIALPEGM